jgi:hypothetical protein
MKKSKKYKFSSLFLSLIVAIKSKEYRIIYYIISSIYKKAVNKELLFEYRNAAFENSFRDSINVKRWAG